ncbi:MAG: SMI1/KNR4 family protein [Armatimonadota bacterium]|nr:SMI1/KNR4 family protein [Armatimonadota bacterium]MDR7520275.1 SMI1/KNR4 family protein [Armatimonadota bacterium]MDR7551020.1 SMI1/KNR4 family protein [Armatimonadota bacterium]
MTLDDIHRELAFFRPGVVRLNPPASPGVIARAEAELGVRFSPSMRAVLEDFNGGYVVNEPILGVPPVQSALDLLFATRQARAHWGPMGWKQEFVEIGSDGCGNPYVLLMDRADPDGEAPVGFFDAGVMDITEVVASSYLTYLWFLIQEVKWYHQADGKPLARDEVLWTKATVVVRPDALSPWRFNEAWMLAHDPALARWR